MGKQSPSNHGEGNPEAAERFKLLSGISSVRHAERRKSRKVRTCDRKKKPTWRDRNSSVES